ncbi:MAG TPA: molybdopterin-guanine dinucleotide biosynthesis protein B [Burkholderiales bacterium]|jgi:molybdopterin-guanine dinucleotide biosynthesis protein B|nr:molybdopterin-guanine dinucleotide biosynthesis protein B [Burkholderiales bacterium]
MKVFGFAASSGSGKTTLLERLIPLLVGHGLRVSVIKHAHHGFDLDQPGKDSFRHRQAGACEVLVSSGTRWALMHELRGEPELPLKALLARLSPCDVVLIEGFKREPVPRVEVHRRATGAALLYPGDPHVVAIASDVPLEAPIPVFPLDDPGLLAQFLLAQPDFVPA